MLKNWKFVLNVKKWWLESRMKKGWDSKLSLELDRIILKIEGSNHGMD